MHQWIKTTFGHVTKKLDEVYEVNVKSKEHQAQILGELQKNSTSSSFSHIAIERCLKCCKEWDQNLLKHRVPGTFDPGCTFDASSNISGSTGEWLRHGFLCHLCRRCHICRATVRMSEVEGPARAAFAAGCTHRHMSWKEESSSATILFHQPNQYCDGKGNPPMQHELPFERPDQGDDKLWILDSDRRVRSISPSPYSEEQKRAVNAGCPKGWIFFLSSTGASHRVNTTDNP